MNDPGDDLAARGLPPDVPLTLGARLDNQARQLIDRMIPRLSWAGAVAPVLARAAAQGATHDRFARVEGEVGGLTRGNRRPVRRFAPVPEPVAATPTAPSAGADEPLAPVPAPPVTPAQTLPPVVRGRLRDAVGPAADVVRIRTDDQADAVARSKRADAVTIRDEVHFRHGRFRPHEDRGFALLAHEARHVIALLRPPEVAQRADSAGRAREEQAATAVESQVLARRRPPPQPGATSPAQGEHAAPPTPTDQQPQGAYAAPVEQPMAAPTGREPALHETPTPPQLDVGQLRRDLMDDLMHRLRGEFERGG